MDKIEEDLLYQVNLEWKHENKVGQSIEHRKNTKMLEFAPEHLTGERVKEKKVE